MTSDVAERYITTACIILTEDNSGRKNFCNEILSKVDIQGITGKGSLSIISSCSLSAFSSFKRDGDDFVVTQSRLGNSVVVVEAFVAGNALEAVTLVYEDGSRPDTLFHFVGVDEEIS